MSRHIHPERRRVARRITTRGGNASGCGERPLFLKTGWAFGLSLFWATAAMADSYSVSGSLVTMGPTTEPGAVAQVEFENRNLNSARDDGDTFTLSHDGLTISVTFLWQVWPGSRGAADAITVEVPDGFYAFPNPLVVDEISTGVLFIYRGQPGV